jgi:hypothetical protein
MTIVLQIAPGAPPPDPELAAREHEAALIAQVRNATIAECQRELRAEAEKLEHLLLGAKWPTLVASAWRAGADMLEELRS